MKVDEETGEVRTRLVMKKGKVFRNRYRVKEKRVEKRDKIDSRFDTRHTVLKWKKFHPRNISVLYLYLLIWTVFSLWVPETWLTWLTHRLVLNQESIRVVVALGLIVPLAAGVFDLSIASVISASAVTASWGMVEQGWSPSVSILLALSVGLLVGATNGFLVVKIKIDSFIATLGMSSIMAAYAIWLSGNKSIIGLPDSFLGITGEMFWGIKWTVLYAAVLAVGLWYVLEHTPLGRYLFATGGGRDAARLAGVQTDRYVFGSLMFSAFISAVGGVLVASEFGSTQATIGAPYLLPAFAAAFFGATQFKNRFNVWGTVLAVFVLAAGVKGLQLAGVADLWVDDLFFGLALVLAVGFSTYRRKVYGGERRWWRRSESGPDRFLGKLLGWGTPKTEESAENAKEWWFDPEDRQGHHLKE